MGVDDSAQMHPCAQGLSVASLEKFGEAVTGVRGVPTRWGKGLRTTYYGPSFTQEWRRMNIHEANNNQFTDYIISLNMAHKANNLDFVSELLIKAQGSQGK